MTYGVMAKRPVPIPVSFHIFKNLTSHRFWLSRWYKDSGERRINLVDELAQIMASRKFKEPKHEIVTIAREASEERASSMISEVFRRIALGRFKKNVILKIEGSDD